MKTAFLRFGALAYCMFTFGLQSAALADGSAISYQGRLNDGTNRAQGWFDLRFSLYDAPTEGAAVGTTLTNAAIEVRDGLFAVQLDFGTGIFNGAPRWLEIGVRTNGTEEEFTTLSPRQALAPVPYALYAPVAGTAGTAISALGLASNVVGRSELQDDAVDSGKIADDSITKADLSAFVRNRFFWKLGGNAGTAPGEDFLGTSDEQPFEIHVNGTRALRLEPGMGTPNLLGGFAGNRFSTDIGGAVIGGGGELERTNRIETYEPDQNSAGPTATPHHSVIAGGSGQSIVAGAHNTISGGDANSIQGRSPFYRAGDKNSIGGGGQNRIASSLASTINGGQNNAVLGSPDFGTAYTTIGGGSDNAIRGDYDPVRGATIGGGSENTIHNSSDGATISGGLRNTINLYANASVIAGGQDNLVTGFNLYASIGGGNRNQVVDHHGVVGGGEANRASRAHATISGGSSNLVRAAHGTVPGGAQAMVRSYGQLAYAGGQFAERGDAQTSVYVCRTVTTNGAPAELFLDGKSERVNIPDNSTWTFDILVTGRTADGSSAAYQIHGAIMRTEGATAFLGTPTVNILGEHLPEWDASVLANVEENTLQVQVNGSGNSVIRWVASIRTVEVSF